MYRNFYLQIDILKKKKKKTVELSVNFDYAFGFTSKLSIRPSHIILSSPFDNYSADVKR